MKRRLLAALATTLTTSGLAQTPVAPPAGLTVDRVVLLMRHGVRPPTKAPPMPTGTADQAWPAWPVQPGYLTPHGAAAVRLIATHDRFAWTAAGLLPRSGCARVRIVADSDQRTIATAQEYVTALAPGCAVPLEHKPQDVADPLFSPIDEGTASFDAGVARQSVIAAAGAQGIAGEDRRLRPLLTRLDAILCSAPTTSCGVSTETTTLAPAAPGKRPKLAGALDRASTAGQILLLEYAEGKPMAEVGWGRATTADIAALSEFHAVEFRLLARPRYVARANLAGIAPLIVDALTAADGAAVTMISGHDTNVASLGGLLDVHWQVPGLAMDDPSPGGAIVLERLHDAAGRHYVRALYRSQSLDQIRSLTPLDRTRQPYVAVTPIAGCTALGRRGLCTEEAFRRVMTRP